LRSLPWIASVTSLQVVVLAIRWQTVRDRGHEFLGLLEAHRPHHWQVCLEVDCPPSPAEACALMRFAQHCAQRGITIGLRVEDDDLLHAATLAKGSQAWFINLTREAIARRWDPLGGTWPGLRALAPSRLLVSGLDSQEQLHQAGQLRADWVSGAAVAPALRMCRPLRTGVRPRRPRLNAAIAACGTAVVLAACASVPQPAVPDGSVRVPVNDSARLAAFTQATHAQAAAVHERSALYNEVTQLRQQVSDLTQAVRLLLQATETPAPAGASPSVAPAPASPAPSKADAAPSLEAAMSALPPRSLEVVPGGLVFRSFQATGRARFEPTGRVAQALRLAALDAASIHVHGFTDSAIGDEANRRVAWARAKAAKQWLLANGAPPARIQSTFSPAGGFLVDPGQLGSASMNRRIEITSQGDTSQAAGILNSPRG
jgi:outer membrane protein OmpA-like peptidoglycan-associated protein